MAKIRLELEALEVESFQTAPDTEDRGTVFGNACSESTCIQDICTCTNLPYAECYATEVNCSGGPGGSGVASCGCPNSIQGTCCTGGQDICSCWN